MLLALQNLALMPNTRYWTGRDEEVPLAVAEIDPWTGDPLPLPATLYKKAERALYAKGECPYIAAASPIGALPYGGGEMTTSMVLAVHALPQQYASPDEVHYVFSFHEAVVGGAEVWSLGITPSGRFAVTTKARGTVLSPVGVVATDGAPHLYELLYPGGGSRVLRVDGVRAVEDDLAGAEDGPFSEAYPGALRVMLLNGRSGLTRCEMTLVQATHADENAMSGWLLKEGGGTTLAPSELIGGTTWTLQSEADPSALNHPGLPTLTVGRYDPSTVGLPLPWGPVPASATSACFLWRKGTSYRNRDPIAPTYIPVSKP